MDLNDELRTQTWNGPDMAERLANLGRAVAMAYPALLDNGSDGERDRWYGQLEAFELLTWGGFRRPHPTEPDDAGFRRGDTPRRAGVVASVMEEFYGAAPLRYGDLVTTINPVTGHPMDGAVVGLYMGWSQVPVDLEAATFRPYAVLRYEADRALDVVPLSQIEPLPD